MALLRDVARVAGVSPATASRALSGTGSASPATRRRVRAAATSLGYQINEVARGLRTQRTGTLGLLVPDVRNPFFTDLAYQVEKAAAAHDLAVIMGNADEHAPAQDRYLQALARHRVDGIIAVPQGGKTLTLQRVAETVPLVLLDRDPGIANAPVVTSDNRGGVRALVDHVVSLGRRDIAVVAGPQSTSTGRERLAALTERLAEHDLPVTPDRVVEGDFRLESGVAATERLLDSGPLDAIVAADNLMALGALMVLRRRGIAVGREVALACVDDVAWFPVVDPAITVVAHDVAALGETAVRLVRARIDDEPVESAVVPMRLIARRSCGETPTATNTEEKTHG